MHATATTTRARRKKMTLVERLALADARRASPGAREKRPPTVSPLAGSLPVENIRRRLARQLEAEGHDTATIGAVLGIGPRRADWLLSHWSDPAATVTTDIPPPPER